MRCCCRLCPWCSLSVQVLGQVQVLEQVQVPGQVQALEQVQALGQVPGQVPSR